jgi:flavin-dependent dehydrogenase
MSERGAKRWDVIVIGGALAGAATARLILRRNAATRILILERTEQFKRRVGESTVEISAYFLGRVMGLTDHLVQHHLPKQGMRFWSMNSATASLGDCSEIGPGYNVRLPGYQVDRAVLDEHVLQLAQQEGAAVRRPVKVKGVRLAAGGQQTVEWEESGAARESTARWVVDASGFAALLGRQEGWHRPNPRHPTAACWTRWTGVKSWDDPAVAAKFPQWSARCRAVRSVATNHLTGYGWWAWVIPLRGGDVSIGVTFDQRLCALPPGDRLADRLKTLLLSHPAGRELFADAVCRDHDVHYRSNLAYDSTTYAVDGAVLVGDAAAFLDPFYSPGMDWIAFSASAAAALIDASLKGAPAAPLAAQHTLDFSLAYERWFRALYQEKYYYVGDHELMLIAFRLDLGMYYLGVVQHVFKHGAAALEVPGFARPGGAGPAVFMALYNRRLATIAQDRRRRGTWGRRNIGRYFPFTSYEFNARLVPRIAAAALQWAALEFREGWRTWFKRLPHVTIPSRLSAPALRGPADLAAPLPARSR